MGRVQVQTGSVDAVLCCNGFQYLRRPEEMWREVRRVLKPGGKVIVSFSSHMFVEKAFVGWVDRNMAERARLVAWYALLPFYLVNNTFLSTLSVTV